MEVSRTEDKYLLGEAERENLKRLFDPLLRKDRGQAYWIRSVYFDNPYNRDWAEKIIGENQRKKIRLRVYSRDTDTVKLEIKNKTGKFSRKETVTISRDDALKMLEGDFEGLLKYGSPTANRVYAFSKSDLLRPVTTVDYYREAYWLPFNDIRLTFDYAIQASKSCDLFGERLPMVPLLEPGRLVLEVKYNGFLPRYLTAAISSVSPTQTTVSKYCTAREILL